MIDRMNSTRSLVNEITGRVYLRPIFLRKIICISLEMKNIRLRIEVYIISMLA